MKYTCTYTLLKYIFFIDFLVYYCTQLFKIKLCAIIKIVKAYIMFQSFKFNLDIIMKKS